LLSQHASSFPSGRTWIVRVTEFEWNHYLADIQAKGPFESWRHRPEFELEARAGVGGVRARDRIECEVCCGALCCRDC